MWIDNTLVVSFTPRFRRPILAGVAFLEIPLLAEEAEGPDGEAQALKGPDKRPGIERNLWFHSLYGQLFSFPYTRILGEEAKGAAKK